LSGAVTVSKPRNRTGSGQRGVDEQPHQVGIIGNSTANRYSGGFRNDGCVALLPHREVTVRSGTLKTFTGNRSGKRHALIAIRVKAVIVNDSVSVFCPRHYINPFSFFSSALISVRTVSPSVYKGAEAIATASNTVSAFWSGRLQGMVIQDSKKGPVFLSTPAKAVPVHR
jgi:hypothetical protein